jgi:hypothetical protein
MPSENLERVLERVRALTPAERQELRARLEAWPTPPQSTEHDLDERLLAAGVIGHIPAPLTDLAPYRRWKPIAIEGKPLSETVIEERR